MKNKEKELLEKLILFFVNYGHGRCPSLLGLEDQDCSMDCEKCRSQAIKKYLELEGDVKS